MGQFDQWRGLPRWSRRFRIVSNPHHLCRNRKDIQVKRDAKGAEHRARVVCFSLSGPFPSPAAPRARGPGEVPGYMALLSAKSTTGLSGGSGQGGSRSRPPLAAGPLKPKRAKGGGVRRLKRETLLPRPDHHESLPPSFFNYAKRKLFPLSLLPLLQGIFIPQINLHCWRILFF